MKRCFDPNISALVIFRTRLLILLAVITLILPDCAPPGSKGGGSVGQVETPVIDPPTGAIEQDTAQILLTCATDGAAVYYTTDGSAPDAGDNLYAAPISASAFSEGPLAIRAIGILGGNSDSEIAQANYTVQDTLGPAPVITSVFSGAVAADFDVTVTFNETVAGFDQSDLTLANASVAGFVDANPVFTVTIHPTADDTTVTVDITGSDTVPTAAPVCTDTSSTPVDNIQAATFSIFFDDDAPQGVITSSLSGPTATSPIPVSVDFGMDVSGFDAVDLDTAGTGTVSDFAGGPRVFTANVTPAGQGTVTVDIGAGACASALTGTANIASPQFVIVYDSVGPSVTVNQSAAQSDPANGTVNFTVLFNEPVTGLADNEATLGGTAGASASAVTEIAPLDGTAYNLAVSGMSGDGTVIMSLPAGAAQDAAGNQSQASTSTDNSVTYDASAPGCTVSSTAPEPTTTSPVPVTVAFTETVTGFTLSDVQVTGGTAGNFQTADNRSFTFEVTVPGAPTDNAVIVIDVAAGVCTDYAGGNPNGAAATFTAHYNGTSIGLISHQNINIVFGQPDYTSSASNRGGAVGADTYTASYGNPVYAAGKLFLPDYGNNRVLVFNSVPSAMNAVADFAIGQSSLTTSTAGVSSTAITGPESVSCNGAKLSIVDFGNNRVLIYNTIPTAGGAAADVVVGQDDFFSSGAGRSATRVSGPESAFITADGRLLIADSVNNRVLVYNAVPTASGAAADLVLGQTDFTSGGAGTSATTLKNPTDVWSDGTKVIVSDAGNNRVLIWNSFPAFNGQAADVVVGQADFTSGTGGTAADKFARQWNLTANTAADQLVVTDLDNHRVLVFNSIPTANGASADVVLGQPDFVTKTSGCTQNAINWPCGACVIDSSHIMIIDTNNCRAIIFEGM